MDLETRKIIARTEGLLLWDRLAETGDKDKWGMIKRLFGEGKLYSDEYYNDCPLCELLMSDIVGCDDCLWPKDETGSRCLGDNSPYDKWSHYIRKPTLKKYAREVFNLIWNAEI